MKTTILTLAILLAFAVGSVNAQHVFTENPVSSGGGSAFSAFAIDIDNDGDIDILSATSNNLSWSENDGSENFTKHIISTDYTDYTYSAFAIDIDNDGDIDVLSNKMAWYENDGSQNFTEHIIGSYVHSIIAIDVDEDGDIDVLSEYYNNDKIAWYENDGSETFTEHSISINADYAHSVFAIDVDGDNDIDVLSASSNDDKIAWYENDGSETFIEHSISTNADGALSVFAIDVDNDGDIDVLSASSNDNKTAWYENDGSETFTEHIISTNADYAHSVFAIDIDGDADIDILSADNNKIAWYENDGSETFTEFPVASSMGFTSVFAIDIDNDNIIDVLSTYGSNGSTVWYKHCIETYSTITTTVCDSYTSSEGNTYTTSGTYAETTTNAEGCDSIITINLTVLTPYQQQICMVTVDTITGKNLVVWEPTGDGIAEYIVYREGIVANFYDIIGTMPVGNPTVFVDATANPMSEPYKYKITTKDTCGNYSSIDSCEYHKTIHLQTSLGSPNGYQLQWTEYEGFAYSTYNIYGREVGVGNFVLVHQSPYGNISWTDSTTASNMEYRIAVERAEPCLNTKTSGAYNQSISNIDNYSIGVSKVNNEQTIIYLYPNPCTGIFTVRGENITKITITDINGKTILTKEDIVEFNNIDISQKSKGVYFVKVTTENSVAIQKLVLE